MMADRQTDFMEMITANAVRAFGEDGADKWLLRSWRIFDDRRPVDMLSHPADVERVLTYLRELLGAETSLSQAGLHASEI